MAEKKCDSWILENQLMVKRIAQLKADLAKAEERLAEIVKMADSHAVSLSGPGGFIAIYDKAMEAQEVKQPCGCVGICKGHDQSSI